MPSASPHSSLPSAPRSDSLIILTLAIGFVMAMIDVTAVNVALSDIALDLSVPLSGLVWVVDGYTLTFAALLLAGGALADQFGARTAYQAGLAVFLIGSILCGLAPGGNFLIAARLLQGAGAALFMPSSLSLLTHTYEDARVRARMLGIWSALVGASSAIGPLVGGILVHAFGWRSVFWINVPLGVLGIVLVRLLIVAPPPRPRPLSLLSHGMGMLMLSGLSFVLIEGPVLGWLSVPVLASVALTVVSLASLLHRERSGSHPLLPRDLFATSSFAAANGTGFLINFAVFGQLFLLSLYLTQARGADALTAGLQLLPMMAAFTFGNLYSGRVSARLGMRVPMLAGLSVAVVMALGLSFVKTDTPYWMLVVGAVLMNLAVGTAIPAMTTTVMQVAGRAHANSAAAALNANRQIGALVGVALMGTILHMQPEWNGRLPLAFGAIAAAYAGAWVLVYRFIHAAKLAK
ncbi:MFS transporter [Herbaspirillum sp. RTI4]|uniref:MFS transporter n=1 Tax=Herbaspirillum sp. RTI4 TaxID=3048640 RepID=UPI002AB512C0|nr:MFS transporter [Herbaspirillum sp. RTI4]MDY7579173.1 MFS transporter [Herbaspirillum sp. RTI4]MEA9983221.1 MFS transporter [Herbaspirillum sp. RTI4]